MLVAKMLPDQELPPWLEDDDISLGTMAQLTLDDGDRITAELVDFDLERREIVVDVVSPAHSHARSDRVHRTIPVDSVVSFEPQPRETQPWPYSDPCRASSFSFARFALMTTIFLCLVPGSIPLFLLLTKYPFGIQLASAISYTLFEAFFTFAATRGFPRFLFTCSAVQPQIPRLLWRHLGFLAILFAFQTVALAVSPSLPGWWHMEDKKGATPFVLVLMLLCYALGFAQVYTNRALLKRAHQEYAA